MTKDTDTPWTFVEGELPAWGSTRAKRNVPEFDFGLGVPAVTPTPVWPVFSRIMLIRLAVAAGFPFLIGLGRDLARDIGFFELFYRSLLSGFIIGSILYALSIWVRVRSRNEVYMGQLDELIPAFSPWLLVKAPIFFLCLGYIARISFSLFDSRFLGVGVMTGLCLAAFYRFGSRPIHFMQEFMLTDVGVPDVERRQRPRIETAPDVQLLAIILLIAWLVPAYLSTAWGIVAVIGACCYGFRKNIMPFVRFAPWRTVLAAMGIRAQRLICEYIDYQPTDDIHWKAPEDLARRRWTLALLLVSLDLTLISALTYFCPWEPFAALWIPHTEAGILLTPDYELGNYGWLHGAQAVLDQLPPGPASLCLAITIFLFMVTTPLVLLVVYGTRLGELENMAQDLKNARYHSL